jgi:hypothetical protein
MKTHAIDCDMGVDCTCQDGAFQKRPSEKLAAAYRFFREHAGYIVGESAVCAMRLARAELWAERENVAFSWEPCQEPWDGDLPMAPGSELWDCFARHPSGARASVCSVNEFPDGPEFRVEQAQLASEIELDVEADRARERNRAATRKRSIAAVEAFAREVNLGNHARACGHASTAIEGLLSLLGGEKS